MPTPNPWITPRELKLFRPERDLINAVDHNADGNEDTGVAQNACDAANNFIDRYLGLAPPDFPVDKVAPALKMLAANIALHIIFRDEETKQDYDDAFMKLKDIISTPVSIVTTSIIDGEIAGNKTECDLDADIDGIANVIPERIFRSMC